MGGWQPELALHWVSELLTHGPGWGVKATKATVG